MRTTDCLAVVLVALLGPLSVAALPTDSSAVQALSAPVAQLVDAAQSAIKERQWHKAEKILRSSTSEAHSDWERYRLDELKAYVLYRERKEGAAAALYARLLGSPFESGFERKTRAKSVAEMYFRAGDYRQAAKCGNAYLAEYADDATIAALVADSQLRLRHYNQSLAEVTGAIDRAEAEHKTPEESWLRIAANAFYGMGDTPSEIAVLQKLIHYYHRREDWSVLVALIPDSQSDDGWQFQVLRLKYDLGMLKRPGDYEGLIFESMKEGMPGKALAVLTQARERGIFSKDRSERMRHALDIREFDEQSRLQHALNRARTDRTGESDALAAHIYLDEGAYTEAAAAAQRAIDKGTLTDQGAVRLNLGIARLRNGQPRLAEDAFNAVSGRSHWARLAQLWELHAEDQDLRPTIETPHNVS